MKRLGLLFLLAIGCADAKTQFERHEKAAWAIEAEATEIIDSVASGGGPDDFKDRLADINKRQADSINAARAARNAMEKPPTRENEIATLEGLVGVMESSAQSRSATIQHANDFADASKPDENLRMTEARADAKASVVDLMLTDQRARTDLIKHKRHLKLLKGLYRD